MNSNPNYYRRMVLTMIKAFLNLDKARTMITLRKEGIPASLVDEAMGHRKCRKMFGRAVNNSHQRYTRHELERIWANPKGEDSELATELGRSEAAIRHERQDIKNGKTMLRAFTLVELLVVVAIIFIFCALVVGAGGGCSVSDGNRVGVVTKFSHKGIINKSWEGELAMGGARTKRNSDGGTSVVANVWPFSVFDSTIAAKMDKLQESGHRAKLIYHQTFMFNPVRRDTSYIVTDVIDVDATPENK